MNGATWNGSYALLPTVPTEWQIVGCFARAFLTKSLRGIGSEGRMRSQVKKNAGQKR